MASGGDGQRWTFTAGADLSSAKYLIVKIGAADDTVILADDADEPYVGVVTEPKASGGQVGVQTDGIARVKSGAAVTRGTMVMADAAGKAIDYTAPGAAATNYALGLALAAAGGADEIIPILLRPSVNTGT